MDTRSFRGFHNAAADEILGLGYAPADGDTGLFNSNHQLPTPSSSTHWSFISRFRKPTKESLQAQSRAFESGCPVILGRDADPNRDFYGMFNAPSGLVKVEVPEDAGLLFNRSYRRSWGRLWWWRIQSGSSLKYFIQMSHTTSRNWTFEGRYRVTER